ncbi:hypothetical protein [Leifsonia sp. NPDC080035]|uniref:DUF4064 domain-containing protein n=1 Tax=Leifsonia sp. NPDC080035 TaxID=3143936 RepID=A0AAU7GE16_9MICO
MSNPEDESKPQQPAEGDAATGGVPPVPPAAPVPPVEPPADAPVPPAAAPEAPAAPAGSYPPPPAAPPAPGAFPAYGATPAAPVAAPTEVPNTVNIAFWLYIASAVLSVVSGIVTAVTAGSNRAAVMDQIQRQGTNLHGLSLDQVADAAIAFAVTWSIITLIFWALTFVLFAFFMRRGANWARIILTVLTALSLLNIIATFGIGALQVIASIVALVLMWLRPSSAWFAAIKASKAPRA